MMSSKLIQGDHSMFLALRSFHSFPSFTSFARRSPEVCLCLKTNTDSHSHGKTQTYRILLRRSVIAFDRNDFNAELLRDMISHRGEIELTVRVRPAVLLPEELLVGSSQHVWMRAVVTLRVVQNRL